MNVIRNNSGTLMILLLMVVFAAATYVFVDMAGGAGLSPDNSNTPNATVPGPPSFK